MLRNFGINSFHYLFVQTLHIICLKWWLKWRHLIKYTTQAPNVRFDSVWLISPHFRRSIVRGSRLCVIEAHTISHFGYIHISQLCYTALLPLQEYVSTLNISMHDIDLMHRVQPSNRLYKYLPNQPFFYICSAFLVLTDFLKNITLFGILHDYTQILIWFQKGLTILNHIGVLNTCQNPHFIDGIFLFFLIESFKFYFFEGIDLTISFTLYLIDVRIRTISNLL